MRVMQHTDHHRESEERCRHQVFLLWPLGCSTIGVAAEGWIVDAVAWLTSGPAVFGWPGFSFDFNPEIDAARMYNEIAKRCGKPFNVLPAKSCRKEY
jgi:hypothetical protein